MTKKYLVVQTGVIFSNKTGGIFKMSIIYRILRKYKIFMRRFYIKIFCKNITIGNNFNFRKRLELKCAKDAEISIGKDVFFNNDCSINAHIKIVIGNSCIFGENVKVYDHNHRFNLKGKTIQEQGFTSSGVVIGDDCWIASNVIILPGTHIENHVVIGTGSVISGYVSADTIIKVQQHQSQEPIALRG